MKIWWGFRLGFDVTLLYCFLNYFSLCKFYLSASAPALTYDDNSITTLSTLTEGLSGSDVE